MTDVPLTVTAPGQKTNWLTPLWPLLDRADPTVTMHEAGDWVEGTFELLCARGLLRSAGTGSRIRCPECHDHVEEVIASVGPSGVRHLIPCPEHLRVVVPPRTLERWDVDLSVLASAMAAGLGATGKVKELVPGRLWRLGRHHLCGTSHDLVWARGLTWDDGQVVRSEIVRCARPIVFVPLLVPPREVWRTAPAIVRLHDVALTDGQGIQFDGMEITAAVLTAEEAARQASTAMLTLDELEALIRKLIVTTSKAELTDDILCKAHELSGSLDKAVAWLKEQTGQDVGRSTIHRALERRAERTPMQKSHSSNSILRPGSSHRRDKRGKTIIEAQVDN